MGRYKTYMRQLDDIRAQVIADFDYWNGQQSAMDRRLNELGRRGNIDSVADRRALSSADEMAELLKERRRAKDTALSLLPLRDFFVSRRENNGWSEVGRRLERYEENKEERQ